MDQQTSRHGPLSGLRIIEMAGQGPAPYSGMLLADLGADVIRIDRPPSSQAIGMDPRFDLTNRGKRSIVLDLRNDKAAEVLLTMVEASDAIIEGFRPGVMERLGIGPDICLARNPALVYGRMTGWGQTGPYASQAGHDIDYIAPTGVLNSIGEADRAPQIPLNLIGDLGGGGAFLTIGVLAALQEASRTGLGQVVDAAIVDGASHLMSIMYSLSNSGSWEDQRGANLLDGGAPFYSVYPTKDGRHMAVGPLEPKFFAEFIEISGVNFDPTKQFDRATWPDLRNEITATLATRTQAEWIQIFEGTDACVTPVRSLSEAPSDPHVKERGALVRDSEGIVQPGFAPRMSNHTSDPTELRPAEPGQHTIEILKDFGFTDPESMLNSGLAMDRPKRGSGVVV